MSVSNNSQSSVLFKQNISLQNEIIKSLADLIDKNKINTTNTESLKSKFQDIPSISISNLPSNIPDLKTYTNTYNKSIALTDDPNNYNKIAFDTYIYLQNKKMDEIQKNIQTVNSKLSGDRKNPPIKAIKNMNNSHILNLEEYPNPSISNTGQPSTYKGNNSSKYPNYLIYGNNGCLQYNAMTSSPVSPIQWSFQPCNATDSRQQFYMKQINTLEDYNLPIKDINNDNYKINSIENINMGFYIVNPSSSNEQCLQLNNDGLSVMPCNMDSTQRFKPMYRTAIP